MERTNLLKIVNGLRYFGVGAKVTRSIYKFPETYWIVTRVNLSKNQDHGTVYGRLVWRGKAKPEEEKITSALKKQWSLLELPNYKSFHAKPSDIEELVPTNQL